MTASFKIALALSLVLLFLPACSMYQARQENTQYVNDLQQRTIAWYHAQFRLIEMCAGPERRSDCNRRLMKEGPWIDQVDDWLWLTMPSYSTIVNVHEEEIRKRPPAPPLYIEYTIGAARYLAGKVDRGEISPEGFKEAFSKVWIWMAGQIEQHGDILARNIVQAETRDNRAWATVGALAKGLGVVLGAGLAAAAVAAASRPPPATVVVSPVPAYRPPVYCQAVRTGNITTINCF